MTAEAAVIAPGAAAPLRLGRRMILVSALSQNTAQGLMFGSFGTLVVEIERVMGVERGLSSAGASLVILALGVISPFLGVLMRHFRLRTLMITGACLCGTGYLTAALATNIYMLLASYGLLVGPGIAMLGLAVPTALVANWFVAGRGRAIGIVNMPVAVALLPPAIAFFLPVLGLSGTYLLLGVASFALIPVLIFVVDRPEHVGLEAHGHVPADPLARPAPSTAIGLLKTGDYWLLSLSAAMLGGGGATLATHIMPMAQGEGVPAELAALLISVLGGAGVLGSLVYGSLADRLGGGRALAINGCIQAVLWCSLLIAMPFWLRLVLTGLIGINAGGMIATIGTALGQRFGAAAVGGALGLWSLLNLPFTVGMPPLAGVVYAQTGGYTAAFAIQIALFLVSAVLATIAARRAKAASLSPA